MIVLCMALSYILELFTLWVIDYLWRYSWCFSWTCHAKKSVGWRERTTGSSREWTFRFVFTFLKSSVPSKITLSIWLFSIGLCRRISNRDRLPGSKRNNNTTYGGMISFAQTGWMEHEEIKGLTLTQLGILTLLVLGMRWYCWWLSKIMEELFLWNQNSDFLAFDPILEVTGHWQPCKENLSYPALRTWGAFHQATEQRRHCILG